MLIFCVYVVHGVREYGGDLTNCEIDYACFIFLGKESYSLYFNICRPMKVVCACINITFISLNILFQIMKRNRMQYINKKLIFQKCIALLLAI